MEKEQKIKRDITVFKKQLNDIAADSLNSSNRRKNTSRDNYTSEDIKEILKNDDELQQRLLSRSFWTTSGIYKRLVLYMSTMLTYDVLITPKTFPDKKVEKNKVVDTLTRASYFVDKLNVESEFSRIFANILIDGVYYGFFKECSDGNYIFQDLEPRYCRTRYKSSNNLPVLEFDLSYFNIVKGNQLLTNINELKLYPKQIQKAYNKYRSSSDKKWLEDNRWYIVEDNLGVVFYYKEIRPLFIATIEAIQDLNDYKGLEKSLDEQELKKILLQRVPIDKNTGELLFTLEEATEMHKAAVKMLRNNPDVDVFTTLAETEMLELQDSKQANRDNLEKMERSVFNEGGISKELFASDGSVALDYSQKTDFALAFDISKIFSQFLTAMVNKKFADKKVFFEVSILPISHYNREDMFDLYLKGAQYGYSKILTGVASGIKQSNLLNLITLENDYLDLAEKMVPLQSSYTTNGDDIKNGGAGAKTQTKDITDKGGAPQKSGTEKSVKTVKNIESQK